MAATRRPSDLTFRLPKEVKPLHYDLYLHPDLDKGTYIGAVTILIDVLDHRRYIALHQKGLTITSVTLKTSDLDDNNDVPIKGYETVDALEELLITTDRDLEPAYYNLTIEFTGALGPDKYVGFYSSTYKDTNNKTR